jgi:hypothetical protein
MADEIEGILSKVGAQPKDDTEEDGGDLSAEALAVKDMLDAHERGDDEAAGRAFKRAYRICAASKGASNSSSETETDDEYEED